MLRIYNWCREHQPTWFLILNINWPRCSYVKNGETKRSNVLDFVWNRPRFCRERWPRVFLQLLGPSDSIVMKVALHEEKIQTELSRAHVTVLRLVRPGRGSAVYVIALNSEKSIALCSHCRIPMDVVSNWPNSWILVQVESWLSNQSSKG